MLSLAIVLFATLGRFAKNDDVTAEDLTVAAAGEGFDIAAKGAKVRNLTQFNDVSRLYSEGVRRSSMTRAFRPT